MNNTKRLAEATALLAQFSNALFISQAARAGCGGEHRAARAFLALAQPDAPEPSAELFGEDADLAGLQAASEAALATELDELQQACLNHQGDALAALKRAEAAEAQLNEWQGVTGYTDPARCVRAIRAAEAQLAAVRPLLERCRRFILDQPHDFGLVLHNDLTAVLTAPSPGAGGGK